MRGLQKITLNFIKYLVKLYHKKYLIGKYNSNINITLSDFGVPKNTPVPAWIPKDNWNDLLAMSLLQGELDHFVVAIVSSEKEWKEWYESPLMVPFPKIEMEIEKTSSI